MNPHSRLEVNTSLFAVDSNIVDGLQIRHPVEEDVALWGGAPVGNRAQALGKGEFLGGEVQFQNVVAGGKWIRKRRWRDRVVGPEDGVEAIPYKISSKCG